MMQEVGERSWRKNSFWKHFVTSGGEKPERAFNLILEKFPDIISIRFHFFVVIMMKIILEFIMFLFFFF
jgi:hypothetical protein